MYKPNYAGMRERDQRASCEGKTKYPSHGTAKKVADRMARRAKAPSLIYRCAYCSNWHIGRA